MHCVKTQKAQVTNLRQLDNPPFSPTFANLFKAFNTNSLSPDLKKFIDVSLSLLLPGVIQQNKWKAKSRWSLEVNLEVAPNLPCSYTTFCWS